MNSNRDFPWKRRFENLNQPFILSRDALENGLDSLNRVENEGVIKRLNFSLELAWKTLTAYKEQDGFEFATVTRR